MLATLVALPSSCDNACTAPVIASPIPIVAAVAFIAPPANLPITPVANPAIIPSLLNPLPNIPAADPNGPPPPPPATPPAPPLPPPAPPPPRIADSSSFSVASEAAP